MENCRRDTMTENFVMVKNIQGPKLESKFYYIRIQ